MLQTAKNLVRLYVDVDLPGDRRLVLGEKQSHYIHNVMRLKPGDNLLIFNGRDGEWLVSLASGQKRAVSLEVKQQTRSQQPHSDLWLAFAPVKKMRLDYLVQKATELGVSRLIPVMTKRTNVSRVNLKRLAFNAIEAAEQSLRLDVPEIAEVVTLSTLIDSWPPSRPLMFCDENRPVENAHAVLRKIKPSSPQQNTSLPGGILIGPEGGFDQAERDLLYRQSQTVAISLGPRVLRSDTAALVAISIWQSACGDWV